MAKKKPVKKKAPKEVPPVPEGPIEFEEPEPASEPEESTAPEAPKEEPQKSKGSAVKLFVIFLLLAIAVVLAYYFIISGSLFSTGPEVDVETFKSSFASAPTIYIVMDVRGVKDSLVSNNVLQCGVDFAGSSGMAGKDAVYFSLGDDGCTAPDGAHPLSDCVSQLENGLVIYVKECQAPFAIFGQQCPGGAKYYSNGMVVTVGQEYALGTCGIHKY
ncbi:hypothetical protein H0O00_05465 [Candidatus Micrarchaeota archaeon]|nr:hypothetical protein [Candidatus Micrarchaeota archaeon]